MNYVNQKKKQNNCWINQSKLFGALLTSNVVKLDFNTYEKSIQTPKWFPKITYELLRIMSKAFVTGSVLETTAHTNAFTWARFGDRVWCNHWDCLEPGQDYWNKNIAVLVFCLVWLLQAAKVPPVPSSSHKCQQNKFCRKKKKKTSGTHRFTIYINK